MGVPHLPAKEDKRTVKSFTCEHRPKRKVHIQQNPSEVSEGSFELAIEAICSIYESVAEVPQHYKAITCPFSQNKP